MTLNRTHLDQLENQSIFIFREAYQAFKNIAMPWSMGKDSNVLIWLARKSFFGKIPFPVLHIDTTYEFPEMLEFREWATKHYNLNLIVKINADARARGVGYETHDPVKLTSGATFNAKTSRFQKCISREAENGFVRSGAAPSHTRSRAQRRQSTKLSPSWRPREQRSVLGARKIIMNAMRCRSCERKDFYDCGSRNADCG